MNSLVSVSRSQVIGRRLLQIYPAISTQNVELLYGSSNSLKDRRQPKKTPRKKLALAEIVTPQKAGSRWNDPQNIGSDFTGELNKSDVVNLINRFSHLAEMKNLASQQGFDNTMLRRAVLEFRRYCATCESLPADLHIKLGDLLQGHGSMLEVFPFFLEYSKKIFPHLEYMSDLRVASDLSNPARMYPVARSKTRKIVFHAGPTNSGKTHHAIERFLKAKSGVYCGPLKMLAVEIYNKMNRLGVPCDLVTGEERIIANPDQKTDADHVSCTVEMTNIQKPVEVCIIDEIQMLRDEQRGWAWLRAFLGVVADEVHVCGEHTAIDILKNICLDTGDHIEVRRYERLTPIEYEREAIEDIKNVQPGDCIVCFNKNHIYHLTRELEKVGIECAVIYGSLPPGTKLSQAERFNNPSDPCNVLVATDAIGMGLNLNIRRIIFYSITKVSDNEDGEKMMGFITPSQALQIAGRSGRYGTLHNSKGLVTTFFQQDNEKMHEILGQPIEPIRKVGIHPSTDQIELFAYYLPDSPLCNLIDVFSSLSTLDDDKYFMCNLENLKQIAELIEHIQLPLRTRYLFCCAPIPLKSSFTTSIMLKFAQRFASSLPITADWLSEEVNYPCQTPQTVTQLTQLEEVHDALDVYQWLGYRFADQFPDRDRVKDMQAAVDEKIRIGIRKMYDLLEATEQEQEENTNKKERSGILKPMRRYNKSKHAPEIIASVEASLQDETPRANSRIERLKHKVFSRTRPA